MLGFSPFSGAPLSSLPKTGNKYAVAITESVTAAEQELYQYSPRGILTESGSSSDQHDNTIITNQSITETGSSSDQHDNTIITNQSITETGSSSDQEDSIRAYTSLQPEISTTNLVSDSQGNWTPASAGGTIISTTEIAPDGTSTAVRVRMTAAYGGIRTPNACWPHDIQTTGSAWVKVDTGTRALTFYLNGGGMTAGGFTATSTWTRYSTTYTKAGYNYNDYFCIGDPAASGYVDIIIWGVQVEVGSTTSTYQVKPIVESPVSQVAFAPTITETGSANDSEFNIITTSRSIRERIAKNRYLNSDQFNLWSSSNTTTSADSIANPLDGTVNADQISNTPNLNSAVTATQLPSGGSYQAGVQTTKSVYAKAITGSPLLIFQAIPFNSDGTFASQYENATFDLSSGTVQSVSGATTTASMQSLGNGWYRCIQTFTPTSSIGSNTSPIAGDSIFIGGYGSTPLSTTIALYAAQLEFNSTATTYQYTGTTLDIGGSVLESDTAALTGVGLLTESGAAAESETPQVSFVPVITETGTASETESQTTISASSTVTETGTGSDSQFNIATRLADVTETGTGADSQSNTAVFTTANREYLRKNLLSYSNDFSNAVWSKGATTVTPNATIAPDGTTTASKIVETVVSDYHVLGEYPLPVSIGSIVTFSVYAKAAERYVLTLQTDGIAGAANANFNLNTGVAASTGGGATNATITSVGSGWYRCSYTFTTTGYGSPGLKLIIGSGAAYGALYLGDGTSGLYVWDGQIEIAPAVTAYVDSDNVDVYASALSAVTTLTETGTAAETEDRLVTALRDVTETGTGTDSQFNTFITAPQLITETGTAADTPLLGNYSTTQTLTETGTSADSQFNISVRLADVTETGAAANTENRTITALRDITEVGSLTELAVTGYPWVADLTESGTASTTENRTYFPGGLLTETSTSADSQFNIATRLADVTETGTAADTPLLGNYSTTQTLTETGTSSDSQFNISIRLSDVTETGTANNTQDRLVTAFRSLTESGTSLDSQFNIATRLADITENGTSADSQFNISVRLADITETSIGADSQFNIVSFFTTLTESNTSADSQFNIATRLADVTETGTSADSQFNTFITAPQLITETGTAANTENRTVLALRDVTETGTANETESNLVAFLSAITETGTSNATENRVVLATRDVTETSTSSDSQFNTALRLAALIESVTATELTSAQAAFISAIQEALTAIDSGIGNIITNSSISEILAALDSPNRFAFYAGNISELLNAVSVERTDIVGVVTETGSLSTIELAQRLTERGILETVDASDADIANVISNSYITEISVAGETVVVWVFFAMDYDLVTSRYPSELEVIADQIYVDNIDVFYMDAEHMFADVALDYDQIYIDNIDVGYNNLALLDDIESDTLTL